MKADQHKHEVTLTFDSEIISQDGIKKKLEEAGFSVTQMDVVEIQSE